MNNENIKTGYKIVLFLEEGTYHSCSFYYYLSKFNLHVEYSLNKKVYPKKGCGPLCVFDNLDDVKNFLIKEDVVLNILDPNFFSFKLFKCNYEESNEIKVWRFSKKLISPEVSLSKLSSGTRLASWVELIEEQELY